MKHIAFATSLICCLLTYHDANAQGFWYVPPGADLSYRYGIDLGNGLGFGYGFGVGYGSAVSPDFALGDAASDVALLQSQANLMMLEALNEKKMDAGSNVNQKIAEFIAKRKAARLERKNAEAQSLARYLGYQASHPNTPSPLSNSEYDRSTGNIVWPTALLNESFSEQRSEIELLLRSRIQKDNAINLIPRIAEVTQEMQQGLRKQIRGIPVKEYIEGRRFLNRLGLEGQVPVS